MNYIVEKISLVLIVLSLIVSPISTVHAAEMTDTERVALIEQITNQIIALLEARIAELTAEMNAVLAQKQDKQINQPVLGAVETMPYTIDVSVEFGKGNWDEHHEKCKIDPVGCEEDFLDGQVRFTIDSEPKKVQLTYYPENNPTNVITTGALFQGNVGIAGYFQPNTKYVWKIEATDEVGHTAVATGEFTTGKY